jgi:hypothetical protein
MKIYLLILLIALTSQQIFLSDGKEEEKDQLQVEYQILNTPGENTVLSYPRQLSNNQKHGVLLWCPGYGSKAADYAGIIRRLASHGFVVVGLGTSPGDGSKALQALNWADEKNRDSAHPLFGKLDMDTVGCSGHSLGGTECERAIVADRRIKTFIINNAGDWDHNGMAKVDRSKPIAIVYGNNGMERPNAEADYGNQNVKAPACLIMMEGADYGHGSGPWDGMAATVAWFRWHLGGERERKADFVGTNGKYINWPIAGHQGNWKGVCKNF